MDNNPIELIEAMEREAAEKIQAAHNEKRRIILEAEQAAEELNRQGLEQARIKSAALLESAYEKNREKQAEQSASLKIKVGQLREESREKQPQAIAAVLQLLSEL